MKDIRQQFIIISNRKYMNMVNDNYDKVYKVLWLSQSLEGRALKI